MMKEVLCLLYVYLHCKVKLIWWQPNCQGAVPWELCVSEVLRILLYTSTISRVLVGKFLLASST